MKPAGVILERWLGVGARVGIGLVNAKSVDVCRCDRFDHRFRLIHVGVSMRVHERSEVPGVVHGCDVSRTPIRISILHRIVENVFICQRELSSARKRSRIAVSSIAGTNSTANELSSDAGVAPYLDGTMLLIMIT
jgi:hypothetical protein